MKKYYKDIIESKNLNDLENYLNFTSESNSERKTAIHLIVSEQWKEAYPIMAELCSLGELFELTQPKQESSRNEYTEQFLFNPNNETHQIVVNQHGTIGMSRLQKNYLEQSLLFFEDYTQEKLENLLEHSYSGFTTNPLQINVLYMISRNECFSFLTSNIIIDMCEKKWLNPYQIIEKIERNLQDPHNKNAHVYNEELKEKILTKKYLFKDPMYSLGAFLSLTKKEPYPELIQTLINDEILKIKILKSEIPIDVILNFNAYTLGQTDNDFDFQPPLKKILATLNNEECLTINNLVSLLDDEITYSKNSKKLSAEKIKIIKEKLLKLQVIPTVGKQKIAQRF